MAAHEGPGRAISQDKFQKGDHMSGILGLIVLVLDIVAIIDVLQSLTDTGKKILWILLIVLLPVIGMILYFLIGKKQ